MKSTRALYQHMASAAPAHPLRGRRQHLPERRQAVRLNERVGGAARLRKEARQAPAHEIQDTLKKKTAESQGMRDCERGTWTASFRLAEV